MLRRRRAERAEPDREQLRDHSHLIMSSMLETLVVFDKDQQTQPYLAESITPTNLVLKWTINR